MKLQSDNYHSAECALRHNGNYCDCGYDVRQVIKALEKIVKELEKVRLEIDKAVEILKEKL